MTCKVEWPGFICTSGEKFIQESIKYTADSLEPAKYSIRNELRGVVGLAVFAIGIFALYKIYKRNAASKSPVGHNNVQNRSTDTLDEISKRMFKPRPIVEEIALKDVWGKTIQDYSSDGLMTPPKSFLMPNPLPKVLKEDPNFPHFFCAKTGQLIRNPVRNGDVLYERGEIVGGQEVPQIAEFIRKKVYTHVWETSVNKTPLKAARLREKIEEEGIDKNLTDQRDKPLSNYLTEDLKDPPKALRLLDKIPEEFEKDETYPQFICPLTQCLIRFPVLDPTDGTTLYEQSAIEEYLKKGKTSPTTREPLNEDDLVAVPNVNRYIKMKLFRHYLETASK